ncbi:MAG: TIGR02300 family protein [Thermoleophilia bacterium]|nr:TIGR02300 family protein [Thermoleophilia bacterium]
MARPELGVKRICPTTGKKFYDLNRDPIVSPYTGEVLQRVMFEPARRGSAAAAAAKVVPQADEEDAELEVPDAELVSLEEADEEEASPAKVVAIDDDVDVDVEDTADDDDTFLAEDEDEDDGDVSDLIGDAADDEDDQ